MLRREFLGAMGAAAAPAAKAAKPPNVVMIYCDDLGYGDTRPYGSKIPTPNLDRMAAEGMRFTHAISANPVCSPSRAALMTGRYPTRVGVPRVLFPKDEEGMPLSEVTMAQALKTRGYRTQIVGKWHLGHRPAYLPTRRGFDHYFGIPYSNDMTPRWLMRDEQVIEEQATLETLTPRYTEEAVRFLGEAKDGPFFLYMPHTYPHIPLAASARFRGKSAQGLYGDVIQEIDWSVGEVFNALRKSGADKNTLVLFSSDNGPWYQGSPGVLRGRKGWTYEGGVREPFLAWMPGRVPRGAVCESLVSMMDVFPTVTKLAGVAPGANKPDGMDIWPLLSGAKKVVERDPVLYFDDIHLQCARWNNWKLHVARYSGAVYSPAPQGGRTNLPLPEPELYNLALDPSESYDVAPENPGVVKTILAAMEKQLESFPEKIRQDWGVTRDQKVGNTPKGQYPRKVK